MNHTVFSKLEETVRDFKTIFLEIRATEREARELLATVDSRLTSEQTQAKARESELTSLIADPSRSATVRRVAEAELDALRQQIFEPSTLEREAFADLLQELAQAVKDEGELRKRLKGQLEEAKAALDEIRLETIGNVAIDPVLFSRYSGDLREAFGQLCRKWSSEEGQA